ncbi:hypothetical protein F511_36088 [Dorcoceras hygrometricum]|uniref:Uncharacterized protein n=1 Tax=Dorcoceras hygrometricum TaxID=472368 RepID=A0A2Z7ARC0_9LAMI|nr:hypothetical protein F511_36088 [Dorcoceras hygrometricum]
MRVWELPTPSHSSTTESNYPLHLIAEQPRMWELAQCTVVQITAADQITRAQHRLNCIVPPNILHNLRSDHTQSISSGCSIQLTTTKIARPNNTKQENKYEVKPQYEELSKQLNMKHAINQCYECMRAIKDRIARLASRLAIISIEPLYHAHQVSRWKSFVRDLQGPSAHQSSVVFRHDKSVGHHSNDSVGLFRHDKSVVQSQRGSQSGHQSICQAQYVCMNANSKINA